MFNISLILCTFFLLLSLISRETICFQPLFNKRQAVASRQCGDQNNTVAICSPTSTSVWSNNTDQEITWKWNNPKFDQYTQLDLYLLYQNASSVGTTNYQTIKTWPGLDKSKGILVQHIDDSWYPSPIKDNSPNVTWIMYLYIVGAGYDIQSDLDLIPTALNFFPVPQSFTLIQTSRNTTLSSSPSTPSSSTITSTSTSTPSNTPNTSSSNSKKLPGWAIAVIVIAALLFILACAALIWAFKRYQNRKQLPPNHTEDEKIPVLTPNKNDSNIQVNSGGGNNTTVTTPTTPTSGHNHHLLAAGGGVAAAGAGTAGTASSINSSTQQLWSPRSMSPTAANNNEMSQHPQQQQQQQNQLGLNSEANQSSSILSSTDALMIADTFRQFMRKPDWNEELELNEKNKKNSSGGNNTTIKE